MRYELAYGRGRLALELPERCEPTLVVKPPAVPLADPRAAVHAALADPVSAPPLREQARGARSACVLICDLTRPVPNGLLLPILMRELVAAGVPSERITVLVATGLHRPNEGAELVELVGDLWVLSHFRVENHFARNAADHVDLGFTSARGTPIRIDRRFVEADLRIATGLVEPHFMAGYSGGRKVVVPGVAHEDTIRTLHSARFMEDPRAATANLDGNPLHEEQLEIVARIGGALAVNTVLDEDRRLLYVNYGEITASHLAAVEHARASCEVPVPRRFSTIVTSAAGYPLDRTYYQTVKAMVTPLDILRDGGELIVASDCTEGIGSAHFRAAQERMVALGNERFLETLLGKDRADIDEWQTEMQLKPARRSRIGLYSLGLPEGDWPATGVERVDDLTAAIGRSIERSGDPAVAVIPEGPYVVPRYRPATPGHGG